MIKSEIWATEDSVPTPTKVPQPVGYRILIRPRGAIEKTKGGIILTDRNREEQAYLNSVGQVIAMGPECYSDRKKPWCKINDWVIYGRYAGAKISVQKVKMVIINDDEILATLESSDVISCSI
jgi:co-chaperonin GroES (HSP10)|tara:strand:+ start:337 stop:705 length:369 start_codon:yes stop_codon:yes gene_type:complete